jgi:hypothetical protein
MPSQLGPLLGNKFAYCLDSQNNRSMIVLGDMAVPKNIPLNYTPFLTPLEFRPYNEFYYIDLEGVSIAGKRLTLPSNLSTVDSDGNGGIIIDSGASFTIFPEAIYKQIVDNVASQIAYRRARDVEANSGFGLCYNVSGVKNIQLPGFAFHFKGGSDMILPHENSFVSYSSDTFCLAMLETSFLDVSVGPAVLIGNYQQQNFYMVYDRENNRLGFTHQTCKTLR